MGLFGKHKELIETWRGRSAELPDAGGLPWQVVWAAVETEPGPSGYMGVLGVGTVNTSSSAAATQAYQGTRHGRTYHFRSGPRRNGSNRHLCGQWIGVATPSFTVTEQHERLVASASVDGLTNSLSALAPSKHWRGLTLYGGPEGLLASRKVSSREPQGWIYDLWLLEWVADRCGRDALAVPPFTFWELPYGVPSKPWKFRQRR